MGFLHKEVKNMGYTVHEERNYWECGYHNYTEFIDDFANLLVKRYGRDHGIVWKIKKVKDKVTGVEDHELIIDVTKANNMAHNLKASKRSKLHVTGREMFEIWRASHSIEDCVFWG